MALKTHIEDEMKVRYNIIEDAIFWLTLVITENPLFIVSPWVRGVSS